MKRMYEEYLEEGRITTIGKGIAIVVAGLGLLKLLRDQNIKNNREYKQCKSKCEKEKGEDKLRCTNKCLSDYRTRKMKIDRKLQKEINRIKYRGV